MMADEVELRLKNVGTFREPEPFILKKGVNVVEAPNSTGKTSFIRGVKLLSMDENDLKGKKHFKNLTVQYGETAEVEAHDGFQVKRTFDTSGNDLDPLSGSPLFDGHPKEVCFAMEENTLINTLLSGESIKPYIKEISGIEDIETAISIAKEIKGDLNKKHRIFEDDLIRIEQKEKQLEKTKEKIKKQQKKLGELPEVDIDELENNKDLKREIDNLDDKIKDVQRDIQEKRKRKNKCESKIERAEKEIERLNDLLDEIGKDRAELSGKIEKATKNKHELEIEIDNKLRPKIKELDDKLQTVDDNFKKRSKYGGDEGKCVACGQPLSLKKLKEWKDNLTTSKEQFQQKLKEKKREKKDVKERIGNLESKKEKLKRYKQKLETERDTKNKREMELENELKPAIKELKEEKEKLEEEREDLMSDFNEDAKEIDRKRREIGSKIDNLRTDKESIKDEIENLKEKTSEASKIVSQIEFTEKALNHLKTSKSERMESARETFNERIMDIYSDFGFEDFNDINITSDYTIQVRRDNKNWSLKALSSSERKTIGITLLVASKQEYYPDYPFFVADEFITSYDPDRFEKLQDKLKDVADYVILTKLVDPKDQDELKIKHKD